MHVSKVCDVAHNTTLELLLSESAMATIARVFLGVAECEVVASDVIEAAWASRTASYTLTPTKKVMSPILPQGLPSGGIKVTVSAQLPSSVVTTFHLDDARCLRVEAHVHPEAYETSRMTISVHRNFSTWRAADPFVRCAAACVAENPAACLVTQHLYHASAPIDGSSSDHASVCRDMLETLSEGQRGRAEGTPVKRSSDANLCAPARQSGEALQKAFTLLRVEFSNLGYGVPAEIAAAPHRVDM
jgi:hypothetical protein